jgi:hypothetical protein
MTIAPSSSFLTSSWYTIVFHCLTDASIASDTIDSADDGENTDLSLSLIFNDLSDFECMFGKMKKYDNQSTPSIAKQHVHCFVAKKEQHDESSV